MLNNFLKTGCELSRKAALHAYAPDSNFRVGAAVLTKNGFIFSGNNCETAAYEGEICGERNAIFNAITNGVLKSGISFIDAIAVSCIDMPDGFNLRDGSPCGACRQVIGEFATEQTPIIIDDKKIGVVFKLSELLPYGFRFAPENLKTSSEIIDHKDVQQIESSAARNPTPTSLLFAAKTIAVNSYAPFSGTRTGAMIVTTNGQAYAGVRVENSSTGLTADALRVAIGRASAKEGRSFKILNLAIAQIGDHKAGREINPMRLINSELLWEFGAENMQLQVLSNNNTRSLNWRKGLLHLAR
ncbi:MAG: cytidine deaminase [Proteobacteria bacterium]|nr:cytidine deaminase [Alphaproteobacteria bacterium]NCC03435.1 cytidine deaminase [Pseudomonadota bacterium]